MPTGSQSRRSVLQARNLSRCAYRIRSTAAGESLADKWRQTTTVALSELAGAVHPGAAAGRPSGGVQG